MLELMHGSGLNFATVQGHASRSELSSHLPLISSDLTKSSSTFSTPFVRQHLEVILISISLGWTRAIIR